MDNPYSIQGITNNKDLYPLTSPDIQPYSTSNTQTTTKRTSMEITYIATDTSMGTTSSLTSLNPLSILLNVGTLVMIRLNKRKKNR
ncbi:MAG: hypothetical protein ACFFFH_05400 [Candidatus Thorarchaeota archaeon]